MFTARSSGMNLFIKSPPPSMDYGTAGLAQDILRLFGDSDVIEKRIIIMSGDRAGILTFGNDMDEAVNVLMEYLRK
jgi:hypothetical protein